MSIKPLVIFLFAATLSSLSGCVAMSEQGELLYKDHPLVNKIWDVRNKTFLSRNEIADRLSNSDYLLLGEIHDNITHHQGQAWVIDQLHIGNRSANVAFEMINPSQQDRLTKQSFDSTARLIEILDQEKNSWHYDRYYRVVFERVLHAGFSLHAANVPGKQLMAMVSKGEQDLPDKYIAYLQPNPLNSAQMESLKQEIRESHCGMLGEDIVPTLVLAQQLRDAVMTDSMIRHGDGDVMVLIAGAGHVRNDRGVPLLLQTQQPHALIRTLAWLEVDPEQQDIADYSGRWDQQQLPFDYVWFTPVANRTDPCESMRKHMERKKNTTGD